MPDAVAEALPQQNPQETPPETSKQEENQVRFAALRKAAQKPRDFLHYISKQSASATKKIEAPSQVIEQYESLDPVSKELVQAIAINSYYLEKIVKLTKHYGVDVATFAIPLLISTLPMAIGAPGVLTSIAQEMSLGATGAFLGVDIGETARSLRGDDVPSSIKNRLKNAAIGGSGLVAAGFLANYFGGDYLRAGLSGADDLLAPPVRLGARAIQNVFGKTPQNAHSVPNLEPQKSAS